MRLIAFGGDERMRGALLAAGRAGWETLHIEDAADVPGEMPPAQAVMLPWPRSFREERLISAKGGLERERVLAPWRRWTRCLRARASSATET